VSPTLMRRWSATNPMDLWMAPVVRTALNMTTSFSRPCARQGWVGGWVGGWGGWVGGCGWLRGTRELWDMDRGGRRWANGGMQAQAGEGRMVVRELQDAGLVMEV
jgi:hypothetical protein